MKRKCIQNKPQNDISNLRFLAKICRFDFAHFSRLRTVPRNFGSILEPFWVNFGILFRSKKPRAVPFLIWKRTQNQTYIICSILGPFWNHFRLHFGTLFRSKIAPKNNSKTRPDSRPFPKPFWNHFSTHFGAILRPCEAHAESLSTHENIQKTIVFQ